MAQFTHNILNFLYKKKLDGERDVDGAFFEFQFDLISTFVVVQCRYE